MAGKVNSSNKDQVYEDLGAQVNAWSGAEHKEVSYKPLCISKSSLVRLSYISKMTGWMDGCVSIWVSYWVDGLMSGWVHAQASWWVDEWTDEWMDGCKGG